VNSTVCTKGIAMEDIAAWTDGESLAILDGGT
jgi:hypothetical protein